MKFDQPVNIATTRPNVWNTDAVAAQRVADGSNSPPRMFVNCVNPL